MRFLDDGPNIPDDLLQARDDGRVVFLCGAGVSFNSGMPSYIGLADKVIQSLGVPENSEIMLAFEPWRSGKPGLKVPIDRIFGSLYNEYDRKQVNASITEELTIRQSGSLVGKEHGIITRISADTEKRPRIVTTNYDLLFEHALRVSKPDVEPDVYEPPMLPIIDAGRELTGVTHLHGQLQDNPSVVARYIISSADFGAAYLAEGWATRFLQSLLDHYTVVFVGYQAEDFPVDYLLQGLTQRHPTKKTTIYAFDCGPATEVESKWYRRGVEAIPYSDHPTLWRTLEEWAARADDPIGHQHRIARLAATTPYNCSPAQHEQVVHLIRSESGARAFADANPKPDPEWISVLDSWGRTSARSVTTFRRNTDTADAPYARQEEPTRIDYPLAALQSDDASRETHGINAPALPDSRFVPRRLYHLMRWIARYPESPTIAWWALQQPGLHPSLIQILRERLNEATSIHSTARKVWGIILEYHSNKWRLNQKGLPELQLSITNNEWPLDALRQFDTLTAPFFTQDPVFSNYIPHPFPASWEDASAGYFLGLFVAFPGALDSNLDVPHEALESVLSILEHHLQQATSMLQDIDTTYFKTPTCYPDRENENSDTQYGIANIIRLFARLFTELSTYSPPSARTRANTWPPHDQFFFRNLTLFAMNQKGIFGADEVMSEIDALPQEVFWHYEARRELIFLIADRWTEFSQAQQQALLDRFLRGPNPQAGDEVRQFEIYQARTAAAYTKSLILHGCDVPESQLHQLAELIAQVPNWREEEARELTIQREEIATIMQWDDSPSGLENLPITDVIEQARMQSGMDFDAVTEAIPFVGLVRLYPKMALEALKIEMDSGSYPDVFWCQLLQYWPQEVAPPLLQELLQTLAKLPKQELRTLNQSLGDWIRVQLVNAMAVDPELAWQALDHIIAGLQSYADLDQNDPSHESSRYNMIGWNVGHTFEHAINAPAGKVAEGLMSVLRSQNPATENGIPREFAQHFRDLLALPGASGHHTTTILGLHLPWLHRVDPQWAEANVVPYFDMDHPFVQAAWSGLARSGRTVPVQLDPIMTKYLLQLFPDAERRGWDKEARQYAGWTIVSRVDIASQQPLALATTTVRDCLRNMSNQTRSSIIQNLPDRAKATEDGWTNFFIPFVTDAWPKELSHRSEIETQAWVDILPDADDAFDIAFEAVQHLLTPMQYIMPIPPDYWHEREGRVCLARRFPGAVLELLNTIVHNSADQPPSGLNTALRVIGESAPSLRSKRSWQRLHNLT